MDAVARSGSSSSSKVASTDWRGRGWRGPLAGPGLLRRRPADEGGEVLALLYPARLVDVHHVARRVVGVLDVGQQLGGHVEVGEGLLRGVVRRGAVEVAVGDMDLEVRVGAHRAGELVADVDGPTLELLERPLLAGLHRRLLVRQ